MCEVTIEMRQWRFADTDYSTRYTHLGGGSQGGATGRSAERAKRCPGAPKNVLNPLNLVEYLPHLLQDANRVADWGHFLTLSPCSIRTQTSPGDDSDYISPSHPVSSCFLKLLKSQTRCLHHFVLPFPPRLTPTSLAILHSKHGRLLQAVAPNDVTKICQLEF